MKIIRLILLLTIFATSSLYAFDLDVNHWSDYSGNLDGKKIRMSLYRFNNNQVRGHFYYIGTEEKIYLAGRINNSDIKLYAIRNKLVDIIFNGRFFTSEMDRFEGNCTFKKKDFDFKLTLSGTTSGTYKKRYYYIDKSTAEVEIFAKQIKLAILSKDKKWLSENINYPIEVRINNKANTPIKNKKEFLKKFEMIFHANFIEKANDYEYFDLFLNYQGIMVNNGEIWFNCISGSDDNKCNLKITAINN